MTRTLTSVLQEAKQQLRAVDIPSFALDAEILLAHVLTQPRSWLLTHDQELLSDSTYEAFQTLLQRRLQREPIAYITGTKEFFGKDFFVDTSTLIPRPDTEILVESVLDDLALLQQEYKVIHLVDVGTGTGCILLSLLRMTQGIIGHGIDISPNALTIAQKNHQALLADTPIEWHQGSLLEPIQNQLRTWHGVLVITANLPYIRDEERTTLAPELSFEPESALFTEEQGSALIRMLFAQLEQVTHLDIVVHIEAAPYNLPNILEELPTHWEKRTYQNLAGQTLFGVARKQKTI